jgi:hypothetical protein
MLLLYMILTAVHMVAIVVTGVLWTILDVKKGSSLRPHFRDIRAVHFGSLYLVPWFLGLAWAFERLKVPPAQQLVFPIGLGLLLLFASAGYVFPRPKDLDPFYYWTRGPALVLAVVGMVCLAIALCWTGGILIVYSLPG